MGILKSFSYNLAILNLSGPTLVLFLGSGEGIISLLLMAVFF